LTNLLWRAERRPECLFTWQRPERDHLSTLAESRLQILESQRELELGSVRFLFLRIERKNLLNTGTGQLEANLGLPIRIIGVGRSGKVNISQ